MKFYFMKTLAVSTAIVLTTSWVVMAATFKDVPSTHWAYSSVSKVTDRGLMLGDLSGNFSPDAYIDKFATSKILAKVAGYKDSNLTSEEKLYYERVYNNQKTFISQYSKAFSKWNSTADKEISYLLEKKILTGDDLNQFVIKDTSGTEQIRALSREEAAVFLVKIAGKNSEASNTSPSNLFADDNTITPARKPYIYYLRNAGVISGGTDNKFNPKGAVTKAAMAVMLDKTLALIEGPSQTASSGTPVSTPATNTNVNNVETIIAVFDKYFETLNVIQVKVDGSQKLYKISPTVSIKINGSLSTASGLQEGMQLTCIVNNSEIIQIDAAFAAQAQSTSAPTSQPAANLNLTTIEGSVSSLNDDTFTKTVGLAFRMISPNGVINTQTFTYTVDAGATLKRGDENIAFSSIKVNDVVTAKVFGDVIYSIDLEEKDRNFKATLTEKKYSSTLLSNPSVIVEDSKGKSYELIIDDKTTIERSSDGKVDWYQLRIGDTLEIVAEYNRAVDIFAYGTTSTVEGIVEAIYIKDNANTLELKDYNNKVTTYPIIIDSVDIYSIRVGNKVKVRLDSKEVRTLTTLESNDLSSFTGTVTSLKINYMTVKNAFSSGSSHKQIYFTDSTVFIDSVSGAKISKNNLNEDMNVYVILESSASNNAKTVTILGEN